ncbi:MAG: NAD-dependent succinate-semialdehyde dehydrogenase [Gammaproteobacteria bacterium]|nr:NAD-dependent succinate-semialdehyde dehydrogenase [Gammaproteobacteria bacterium]
MTTIKLAREDLLKHQAWIDGRWQAAASGASFAVHDPATGELLAEVSDLGADDTSAAISAADSAFAGWRALTAKQRSEILYRWYQLMLQHADDLAMLITREQGKPLAEAQGEIGYAASFVQWFAEEAKRAYGELIPSPWPDARIQVLRQPIGVVASITPWNFPAAMITRKATPALAAGCPVVIKPSEETPLTALALAVLADEAGFPPGVFNIVTSNQAAAVGEVLSSHPDVAMLSFTGSTAVGKLLMRQCASTVKKTAMELGGNAPFIVFADADLDAAVDGLMVSKFRNTGQTCVCANRILVQDDVYAEFADRLRDRVGEMKQGMGTGDGVMLGPLINRAGRDKVQRLVDDALAQGAACHWQGELGGLDAQRYYPPTVLTGIQGGMAIASEEIFGPVAALTRFHDEAEAIQLANATRAGLAAYFYARDIGRIWRVQEALEYGIVGVNAGIISTEVAPFGGVKESGLGREGSRHGMEEFLQMKYVLQGGLEESRG